MESLVNSSIKTVEYNNYRADLNNYRKRKRLLFTTLCLIVLAY